MLFPHDAWGSELPQTFMLEHKISVLLNQLVLFEWKPLPIAVSRKSTHAIHAETPGRTQYSGGWEHALYTVTV
jgi:hypothetical protein